MNCANPTAVPAASDAPAAPEAPAAPARPPGGGYPDVTGMYGPGDATSDDGAATELVGDDAQQAGAAQPADAGAADQAGEPGDASGDAGESGDASGDAGYGNGGLQGVDDWFQFISNLMDRLSNKAPGGGSGIKGDAPAAAAADEQPAAAAGEPGVAGDAAPAGGVAKPAVSALEEAPAADLSAVVGAPASGQVLDAALPAAASAASGAAASRLLMLLAGAAALLVAM